PGKRSGTRQGRSIERTVRRHHGGSPVHRSSKAPGLVNRERKRPARLLVGRDGHLVSPRPSFRSPNLSNILSWRAGPTESRPPTTAVTADRNVTQSWYAPSSAASTSTSLLPRRRRRPVQERLQRKKASLGSS